MSSSVEKLVVASGEAAGPAVLDCVEVLVELDALEEHEANIERIVGSVA
ncbi:MAG TPA: hypothetical protein VL175_18880 [Pirellulales bacterium]|nr:hypothetical protein [Pirellulales bacterium]